MEALDFFFFRVVSKHIGGKMQISWGISANDYWEYLWQALSLNLYSKLKMWLYQVLLQMLQNASEKANSGTKDHAHKC